MTVYVKYTTIYDDIQRNIYIYSQSMHIGQVSVNYMIFLLHYAYCCCCFCGTRWTVNVSAVVAIAVGVAAAAGGTSRCSIP